MSNLLGVKKISTLILWLLGSHYILQAQDNILPAQDNENFTLVDGVTVVCSDADVEEVGTINGIEYTRRTKDQITEDNASNTCTSGITDMNKLFYDATSFNEASKLLKMACFICQPHSFYETVIR